MFEFHLRLCFPFIEQIGRLKNSLFSDGLLPVIIILRIIIISI
ncbi:hypothetical protein NEIFLAOT_00840 [Neisseria flavescens NRL30031/H210]|uniref:Uncharacterized protein n=1 Tax=Neisseria flavescens NRL30031/H210 TaxID=546264 RepID=C0ELN5_NEIFL|nr:hypothetical protein NEIFLAOT_00840 [Neisseria flavescens NRL30031/H210]